MNGNAPFEVGKYYRHTGGGYYHVSGTATLASNSHSPCFVGETPQGGLVALDQSDSGTTGYFEITREEFEHASEMPVTRSENKIHGQL